MTEQITIAGRRYDWSEIPFDLPPSGNWAHHGVAFLGDDLVTGVPAGTLLRSGGGDSQRLPVTDTHGISADPGIEGSLWVADPGRKFAGSEDGEYRYRLNQGQVLRVDRAGELLQAIRAQALPPAARDWRPSGVVAHGSAADGLVFVTDGYGLGLVHCFDRAGRHLWSIDGEDSGTRFDIPHAIAVDHRHGDPQLLVADRSNRRLVAFDLRGRYLRTIADSEVLSPSGFAFEGDRLWLTELNGGLVVIDADDRIIERIGIAENPGTEGWPNVHVGGMPVRPPLTTGVFRSPHGIAIAADGRVAVTEWVIGGRLVVLTPS